MNTRLLARRRFLNLCGAAGTACLLSRSLRAADKLIPAKTAVDHLLLGVSDLDQGIVWVQKSTGVKASLGGSHPGVGTRNALISLGGRQYLELVAPDPAQTAYNFYIDVRKLNEPRLITWAALTTDIQSRAKGARDAGYQVFGPRDGSRARTDGKLLQWKTLGVLNKLGGAGVEPIPFFIEWAAESPHPARDSPAGCSLQSFEIEHADPASVKDLLGRLGLEADVKLAREVRLVATLKTPRGEVKLS